LNSLPDAAVKAETMNSFKGILDRFWDDQDVKYNLESWY